MTGIRNGDISQKPEELEKCLDQIFGSGGVFLKTAIIQEVKMKFGLTQDFTDLKECFEAVAGL